MVKILKEMLYLEAKDKEFLLSNITKITQGKDWLFEDVVDAGDVNARDYGTESSSTWNYRDKAANVVQHRNGKAEESVNYDRLHVDDDVDDGEQSIYLIIISLVITECAYANIIFTYSLFKWINNEK